MGDEYRADKYSRQAQRFVNPLYIKDGIGGYDFSSTMTFIEYKNHNFCIFAAHALPLRETTIDNIGWLTTDGKFTQLSKITKSFKIYRDHDIVVCNTVDKLDLKNYFVLDRSSSTEFKSESFGWVGFPKKKAVNKIHKTKASKEHIQEYISILPDGVSKWNNAKFLLLGVPLEKHNETMIMGEFENKNVDYEIEGFKGNGYSLKGMSGGAMFFSPEKINTKNPSINDFFKFAGIGLEYINNKYVKGISRPLVVSLLEGVLNESENRA